MQLNRLERISGNGLTVAIETSTPNASLALANGAAMLHLQPLGTAEPTAKTIALGLDQIMQLADSYRLPISLVAVAAGPGSFTGLRIGVTMAKALAYACSCPIAPVDTLATMVQEAFDRQPDVANVHVALNAYRGQLFACSWTRDQWLLAQQTGDIGKHTHAIDLTDWCKARSEDGQKDSLIVIEPGLANKIGFPDALQLLPSAKQVAQIGTKLASLGRTVDAIQLVPNYLRASAAEEKLSASG